MKKNNEEQFCFGDDDTYGIPAVEVNGIMYKLSYDQLKDFASEFYGKVLENQLVTAGEDNEPTDTKWIVVFLPDINNPGMDTFNCRHAFKRALESYRLEKQK